MSLLDIFHTFETDALSKSMQILSAVKEIIEIYEEEYEIDNHDSRNAAIDSVIRLLEAHKK